MQKGDKFVSLREVDADPLASANTRLIAALVTLGIPLDENEPFTEIRESLGDGKERRTIVWLMQPKSACGKYDTVTMMRAWNDRAWLDANREHPLTYLKFAFENHSRLVDHIKNNVPLGLVRKGARFALIPLNASSETRQKFLSKL